MYALLEHVCSNRLTILLGCHTCDSCRIRRRLFGWRDKTSVSASVRYQTIVLYVTMQDYAAADDLHI